METIYTPWTLFTDLGLIFALLLVGKLIRAKVKFIQQLFIPPSLLAGLLGLALGPNGFDILPFSNQLGISFFRICNSEVMNISIYNAKEK